ncbi:MAG: hypothetical protein RIR01_737 [Bacteroidota bacterium]|jgi:hypothetical protein
MQNNLAICVCINGNSTIKETQEIKKQFQKIYNTENVIVINFGFNSLIITNLINSETTVINGISK